MLCDDHLLLRLHLEAVWDIRLPPIVQNDVRVLSNGNQPPWLLYVAQVANEHIHIWRSDVEHSMRQVLLLQAEDAIKDPVTRNAQNIQREAAFKFTEPLKIVLAQAQQLAQPITLKERTLVTAFQTGREEYFFSDERKPLIGVINSGRLLSLAHSARRTAEACELGIDTLPDAQRRGYALAATLLWTLEVQREGLTPIYSALAENTASFALAEAAGYRVFARGLTINSIL